MAKLIELKEAAAILGITPEELADLRTRNQVFGYRDGSTWKFKEAELERFASQQGIDLGDPRGDESRVGMAPAVEGPAEIDEDLDELVDVSADEQVEDLQDSEGPDSVLISEEELGGSDPSASSTIIGRNQLGGIGSDLELKSDATPPAVGAGQDQPVVDDRADEPAAGESEIKLADGGADLSASELRLAPASDVNLSEGEGESQISLEGESTDDSPTAASELRLGRDSGSIGHGGSELDLDSPPVAGGSSELRLAPGSEVSLDEAGETGAHGPAAGSGAAASSAEGSELSLAATSDIDLTSSDFDLDLDASDDDLNVVGSGIDSDITLGAGDSGINLNTPSDSGISLETTPPELAGSDIESLELGEADIVDLGDDVVELDDATLQADDDFLLTPVEADAGEDTESGSQVIALDSEEIDAADATVLGDAEPVMEADPELATLPDEGPEGLAMAGAVPEAPFSLAQVLALGGVSLLLALSGFLVLDVVRHIWSWDEPYTLNSTLIDTITGMFG